MYRLRNSNPLLVVLTILITCWFGLMPVTGAAFGQDADPLVEEAAFYLATFHVKELDLQALPKTSMEELLRAVNDPYTEYMEPQEFQRFVESLDGSFGGVGIQIEKIDDYITVVAPLKNTPAYKAGLQPGDRVLAADGNSLVGASTETAISLIRGKPGTKVILTVERGGEIFQVTLERALIKVHGPEWEVLEGSVGYLRLYTFGAETAAEVELALAELAHRGIKSLIVDVRGNPGGLLEAVVEIAGNFLPKGAPVVHVRWKDEQESFAAEGKPLAVPLVVLVDGGSASASEILAGAIQDYGLGALVGTNTFGKGSVQTLFRLSNGGVLKMTTAKYVTPVGRLIEGAGLMPEHQVLGADTQLDYALGLLGASRSRQIVLTIAASEAEVAGRKVSLEAPPFIRQGRAFVPLRFVSESLGAVVNWDQESQKASIFLGPDKITLAPGELTAEVNGKVKTMDVPSILENERIFVPIRFVAETLGSKVDWDSLLSQVRITK
ncbi:MAG: S41 family peptidase [Bacillota bacterium]